MLAAMDMNELKQAIRGWATEAGFSDIGVSGIDLRDTEQRLKDWLLAGYQGDMEWMASHGDKRTRPELLEPGTIRVISARLDYLPDGTQPLEILADNRKAYVSRYALGRDYHKMMRKRLAQLGDRIRQAATACGLARAFVDSAPVMEKPLDEQAGLGWQGKHTLIINRAAGSFFFLGENYTDLPLPIDEPATNHCGSCRTCMDVCPTDAIVAPYQLDARRCISYLTIEHRGSIPVEFREAMGNRVFGCDDCQLFCPWNRFNEPTAEADFQPRHELDDRELLELFSWTEEQFLERTLGSAIRRTGYQGWMRNLAVAIGNGPATDAARAALSSQLGQISELVDEHIHWALKRLQERPH